jgi:DNA polymerase III sliding clamp (beta) subunit (PCNA family)
MKFKVEVKDLQYAMRIVKDVVHTSAAGSVVGCKLQCSEGKALFSAFNGDLIVKVAIKVYTEEPGECIFEAAPLFSAISKFSPRNDKGIGTEAITVHSTAKSKKLSIATETFYSRDKSVPQKRAYPLLDGVGFPDLSKVDSIEPLFSVSAGSLLNAVKGVAFSLSSDKSNMIFTGSLLTFSDNKLKAVATNGITLAEHVVDINYKGHPKKVVVPGTITSKVALSFFEDEIVDVCLSERHFFIKSPHLVVGGPIIREEYPDYSNVIVAPTKFVLLDKYIFLDNLINLVNDAADVADNRVHISSDGTSVLIRCGNSENSGIPVVESDKNIKFECNLKLLILCIRDLIGQNLKFGISGPEMPVHFFSTERPPNGSELKTVLVPLSADLV